MSTPTRSDGERHPNVANFELGIGGPGIPDGKGGFLPGTLTPISVSGLETSLVTFETTDGKAHSGGRIKSAEVSLEFYANDPIQMGILLAWWLASKMGLPGHNPPVILTVRGTDEKVLATWEVERMFLTSPPNPPSLDRGSPAAAKIAVKASAYNCVYIPG